MKKEFIHDEIFLLTISGAFGRNKIYKEESSLEERSAFRKNIKKYLEMLSVTYTNLVSDDCHYENIKKLESMINENNHLLNNNKITFGTAQKLFNLYLKYLWCLGEVQEPPHCPIDSIVLSKINGENNTRWTKINGNDYQRIIEKLKCNKAKNKKEGDSIATWELREFSRR